ncbi:hypothetical protein AVEN_131289-1 [Araneus ventricosus]|uniref:Uncharacterized protein n=1 Tax=Araneus ventricosus TaxID=182803 RepID=A0A4Y2HF56_ARAVE|nr:hypothetical protein AVEN_131289-1 [Araneus ventricosus]
MNELLGWYGYEKVDSRDTQGLNLTHFASNNSSTTGNNNPSSNGVSPPSSAMEGSDVSEDAASHHEGLDEPSRLRSESISPGQDGIDASEDAASHHEGLDEPCRLRFERINPGQDGRLWIYYPTGLCTYVLERLYRPYTLSSRRVAVRYANSKSRRELAKGLGDLVAGSPTLRLGHHIKIRFHYSSTVYINLVHARCLWI